MLGDHRRVTADRDAAPLRDDYDVVVVGSGGAGLTAALASAVKGARVLVVESAARFGGSTSVSGGQVWVPGNHRAAELGGFDDTAEDARRYCLHHSPGRDPALIDAFVAAAPVMACGVEEHAPIRFTPMRSPDSFAEGPGGRWAGRNLEVAPVSVGPFSPWQDWTWSPPYPAVLTNDEVAAHKLISGGAPPMDVIGQRIQTSQVTFGVGLIVGLLRGCHAAGVEVVRNHRVLELRRTGGAVTGVVVDHHGATRRVEARRGVVLATGGFEHDHTLADQLLDLPDPHPASPPVSRGDGLRLAARAGAMLGHLSESWCWPVTPSTGTWDDPDNTPRSEIIIAERALPHVIWVNAAGQRFVNEASHNCALSFTETDPATNRPRNLPAYAIGDAQYRRRYTLAGAAPTDPLPDWVTQAGTLADLAAAIDVDVAGLVATVATFNQAVKTGHDAEFGRGAGAYDRYLGDADAAHPNLGTIEEPPFFAMPVLPGLVGAKGGPRTDAKGRVLDWDGGPISGLFAAGNAADSVIGPGILSSGMTLGLALTWGWLAGVTAAATSDAVS